MQAEDEDNTLQRENNIIKLNKGSFISDWIASKDIAYGRYCYYFGRFKAERGCWQWQYVAEPRHKHRMPLRPRKHPNLK